MKPPLRRRVLFSIALMGSLSVSYLLGAAAMFFELPTSDFLDKAFKGARAWNQQRRDLSAMPSDDDRPIAVSVLDDPGKTFDGFTLYTKYPGAQAVLINMRGDVVHQWDAPFRTVWPNPKHVRNPVPDTHVHFFGCHLYANGDLLAVYHGFPDTPYGYGLVKLDKDAKVLWAYAANVHHTLDVGEDGLIYALTHEIVHQLPPSLRFLPTPCLVDYLVVLSPDGKELKRLPIIEALHDSPYAALLPIRPRLEDTAWDIFHANSVEVLTKRLAPKFPLFRAGQILISVRELDAVAVLDPQSGKAVWAARGPWRQQHAPHFLSNGRLLLFDNHGHPLEARVLEYDPSTQALPWCFPRDSSRPFVNEAQGECQRLPNGNTLIVASNQGELREVTVDQDFAWVFNCNVHVPWARRYAGHELEFLKGVQRARP